MAGANRRLEWLVSFNADTTQLQQALQQAIVQLRELGNKPQIVTTLQEASTAALELERHLSSAVNTDTGKLDLKVFNDNLQKSGKNLTQYGQQLRTLGANGTEAFLKVAQAVAKADLPLKRSSKLLNDLWITMKNTMRWQLTSSMLHGFIGSIETAYNYTKDLNESLNNIRIVTGKSTEEMAKFAEQANKVAKALSTTTTEYTDASLIYYRQGLSDQEAQARANATINYANVSGLSTTEAAEQLTAIWNNFDKGGESLEYYIDVITKLGATTASSSEEISTGMQKFAAVANTVGLSYEYAASALATIMATTRQDADIVGTSLRTIFARLESLKLGETLDDDTKLSDYTKALATIGVNIKDANGELKDMDIILDELGTRWQSLTRDQKVATAQTVAGVRQYAQLIALMDNWDFMQTNLATSYGSEGELSHQAAIYAESWKAAKDRVTASLEDIYNSIINQDFFISLDNALTPILTTIAKVIDSLGGMKGALTAVSLLMFSIYGDKIAASMSQMVGNLGFMTGLERERARELQREAAQLEAFYAITRVGVDGPEAESLDIHKKIVMFKTKANEEMDHLNERQRELLKNDLERLDILERETQEYAKQATKAQQSADEAERAVKASMHQTIQAAKKTNTPWDTTKVTEQFGGYLSGNGVYKAEAKEILALIQHYTTAEGAVKKLLSTLKSVAAQRGEFQEKVDALKALEQQTDLTKEQVLELKRQILGLPETADETEIDTVFQTLGQNAESANKKIIILKNVLQNLFGGRKNKTLTTAQKEFNANLETMVGGTDRAAKATAALDAATQKAEEELAKLNSRIDNLAYRAKNLSEGVIGLGRALGQVSLAITAIQNLGRVFTDEDMTDAERLTTILTSLSMLLPVVGSSIKLLTDREAAKVVVTTLDALKTGDLAKAHAVLNTTILGTIVTLLPYIAALGAIAAILYGLVKWYNKTADAAKEAAEQAEKLNEAYNTAKTSYSDLTNSIKSYTSALENLIEDSEDYAEVLEDVNEQALELIENNSKLAASAYRDSEGVIRFKDGALEEYQKEQKQSLVDSQIAALSATYTSNEAALAAKKTSFLRKNSNLPTEIVDDLIDIIIERGGALLDEDIDTVINSLDEDTAKIDGVANLLSKDIEANRTDLITLANSIKELTDSNKFLLEEMSRNYLAAYNEQFNQLTATEQNALLAITTQQNKNLYKEIQDSYNSKTSNRAILGLADEYTNAHGYASYKRNFNGTFTFYDEQKNAVAENIDTATMRSFLADKTYLERAYNAENIEKYITSLQKLKTVGNTLGTGIGDEFLGFVQKVNIGFNNLSSLSAKEIQNIRDNIDSTIQSLDFTVDEWSELGYQSATEYANAIKFSISKWDPNEYIQNLANKYATAATSAVAALDMIQSGKLLSDTGAAKLKEQFSSMIEQLGSEFKDIYNFGILDDIGNQSLFDQAASITEVLTDIANPQKLKEAQQQVYEDTKAFYEKERDAAKTTRTELEQLGDIDLTYLDEEIDSWQDKINNLEIDPIKIDIDFDEAQIKGMLTQLDVIGQAAKLVDENYQVAADNIAELVETMPELLDDATINDQTGVLELNKETVSAFVDMADDMRLQNGLLLKDVLAQRVESAQQELNLAQEVKNKSIDANKDITLNAIQNSGIEESERKRVATEIIKAKIKQRVEETQQSAQTLSDTTNDNEQMADSAAYYGEQVASQWTQAASDTYEALHKAFYNAAINQDEFANGTPSSDFSYNQIKSITSGNYGIKKKEFNVVRENVKNPYENLLAWLNEDLNIEEIAGTPQSENDFYRSLAAQVNDLLGISLTADQLMSDQWVDQLLSGTGNSTKAKELIDTLISDKVYELGQYTLDYSQYLADRNAIETASKGKQGSSITAKTVPQKFEDPFYRINKLLEYQENLLKDIDTQLDRTYGIERLNIYEKKLQNLQKEEELLREKQRIANEQRLIKKDELLGLVPDFIIDEESGVLENYEQIMKQLTDERIAMYEAYNDQAKPGNKYTKYDKDVLDQMIKDADADFETKKAAVEAYTEAVDEANNALFTLNDNLREQSDIGLTQLSYKLELYIEVKDMKDKARDFAKTIAESFGDELTHGIQSGQYGFEQANADMNLIPVLQQQYENLKLMRDSATDEADFNTITEQMKDLQDKLISAGEALLDWSETLENIVPNAINAAADRFSWFIDQLNHTDTIANSIKELYALQGVTIKTAEGFNQLQAAAQVKVNNAIASSKLNRQYMEGLQPLLDQAKVELDALNGDETNPEYDMRKKKYEAYLSEYNKYQEALYSSAKTAMEAMEEMYKQSIEKAMNDFDKAASNGVGLDWLQERFERYVSQEERYYDAVNEAYQVQSWYAKIQADLDNSSLLTHKNELKELQEEIDLRRQGNSLSKYDMDILNAKYNLLQAQIALEDAQNAKNSMRLVRDRQGNWNYQFTANPEEIQKAQQAVLDAQNEYYNTAKQGYKDTVSQIISTKKKYEDALTKIYNDTTLSDEEQHQKRKELESWFNTEMTQLYAELDVAAQDMRESGKAAIDDFQETYIEDLGAMAGTLEDFEANSNQLISDCNGYWDDYKNKLDQVASDLGVSADGGSGALSDLDQALNDISEVSKNIAIDADAAVDAITSRLGEIDEAATSWNNLAKAMQAVNSAQNTGANIVDYVAANALGFREETDYSEAIALINKAGANGDYYGFLDELYKQRELKQESNPIYGKWANNETLKSSIAGEFGVGLNDEEKQRLYDIMIQLLNGNYISFASGGYTGEFNNAKLAFLHQKELVLNENDTANLLTAVGALRSLPSSMFSDIENVLDGNARAALMLMSEKMSGYNLAAAGSQTLEQHLTIEHVEFPNVSSAEEIEKALLGLVNDAAQYAQIRND